MPPKELMASTCRRRPAALTAAARSASGLRMPVVVSQWTSATSVMSGSAASRSATSAAVGGTVSSVSNTLWARAMRRQISTMRRP